MMRQGIGAGLILLAVTVLMPWKDVPEGLARQSPLENIVAFIQAVPMPFFLTTWPIRWDYVAIQAVGLMAFAIGLGLTRRRYVEGGEHTWRR